MPRSRARARARAESRHPPASAPRTGHVGQKKATPADLPPDVPLCGAPQSPQEPRGRVHQIRASERLAGRTRPRVMRRRGLRERATLSSRGRLGSSLTPLGSQPAVAKGRLGGQPTDHESFEDLDAPRRSTPILVSNPCPERVPGRTSPVGRRDARPASGVGLELARSGLTFQRAETPRSRCVDCALAEVVGVAARAGQVPSWLRVIASVRASTPVPRTACGGPWRTCRSPGRGCPSRMSNGAWWMRSTGSAGCGCRTVLVPAAGAASPARHPRPEAQTADLCVLPPVSSPQPEIMTARRRARRTPAGARRRAPAQGPFRRGVPARHLPTRSGHSDG